jgi:hypothetical protein
MNTLFPLSSDLSIINFSPHLFCRLLSNFLYLYFLFLFLSLCPLLLLSFYPPFFFLPLSLPLSLSAAISPSPQPPTHPSVSYMYIFLSLKVWWPDATLFYLISFFFHTYNTFTHSYIHEHSPRLLSIPSSLISSVADTSLGCRVGNRTRARLSASRHATN